MITATPRLDSSIALISCILLLFKYPWQLTTSGTGLSAEAYLGLNKVPEIQRPLLVGILNSVTSTFPKSVWIREAPMLDNSIRRIEIHNKMTVSFCFFVFALLIKNLLSLKLIPREII